MIATTLLAVALTAYLVAWSVHLKSFRSAVDTDRRSATPLLLVAAAFHVSALVSFWLAHLVPPLVGFGPVAATLALAVSLTFLATSKTPEGRAAGLLVLPAVVALLGTALWAGLRPAPTVSAVRGTWFVIHVVTVLMGYAILLLGSVAATMYLLQFRALKRKDFGNVFRSFPSLESLDRMNSMALGGGLAVLTIGLLVGWSIAPTAGRGLALSDRDVFFAVLTIVAYGSALAFRLAPGGKGQRTAELTVIAWLACTVAFTLLRVFSPAPELFL